MGQYCGFCGRYLNDGEVCTCQGGQQQQNPYPTMGPDVNGYGAQNAGQNPDPNMGQNYGQGWDQNLNQNYGQNWNQNGQNWDPNGYQGQNWSQQPPRKQGEGFKGYMKRLGFLDQDTPGRGAYENDADIVPDCLDLSDGEIPIKQFTIASMNNRVLGIPIEKAVGRVQVTNKRVVFRAPGKGMMGRTCRTHEFSVDELAGVTVQKRVIFQFWALFVGLLCAIAGFAVYGLLFLLFMKSGDAFIALSVVFGLLFGFAGTAPFFFLNKKWFLKTLALGTSFAAFMLTSVALSLAGRGDGAEFFSVVFLILAIICGILMLVSISIGALRPDLSISFQGKTAVTAFGVGRGYKHEMEHTTYTEILPYGDWEACIREINAIIIDVQKLGDYAVEKWKK